MATTPDPDYRRSLFDRYGPDAADYLRAAGSGILVAGIAFGAWTLRTQSISVLAIVASLLAGAVVAAATVGFLGGIGRAMRFVTSGASTPYAPHYSYEQALIMQGRVDEALRSLEATMARNPGVIEPRLRAAELYALDRADPIRAATLLREVQRAPTVNPGQFIYATNRLVDLLTGPLDDPGRAAVELRRLIERCPGSPAAEHARVAIAELKPRLPQGQLLS